MTAEPAPTRRRPGRPRGADPAVTREAVLDAAVELFGSRGYRGASLAEVAAAAGLSNAGLLHHFPSKEHVLSAVLRRRDEVDARDLDLGRDADLTVWERLDVMVDLVALNARRPGLVRLYSTVAGEATDAAHPAHDWLTDHLDAVVAELATAFEDGKAAGLVAPDAPSARLARTLVAVLDGLQIQWLAGGADATAGDRMIEDFRGQVADVRDRWSTGV